MQQKYNELFADPHCVQQNINIYIKIQYIRVHSDAYITRTIKLSTARHKEFVWFVLPVEVEVHVHN